MLMLKQHAIQFYHCHTYTKNYIVYKIHVEFSIPGRNKLYLNITDNVFLLLSCYAIHLLHTVHYMINKI
jgi:hypothetical protein